MDNMKACVIGSGAWGTTLAKILAENGHEVVIWSHSETIAEEITTGHENKALLPGVLLPDTITSTTSLPMACQAKALIVLVVASEFYSTMAESLGPLLGDNTLLLSATKGIDRATLRCLSEILFEKLPASCHDKVAILSGPNISKEIAARKPSATVISSYHNETAVRIQSFFKNDYFRVYTNNDVTGTELGGTLKNIIAIAAGAIDGLGLGDNLKSALMVRGLVEMMRFAMALGARPETLSGLAGMGDLIVTCSSVHSRNHFVGEHLGKGMALKDILYKMTAVAEGVETTRLAYTIAQEKNIDMPVTEQVYKVLFENQPVEKALR
ncbi:MAG: NAD(P)-dependent glycerol-3-phosphate dehydrogenase, partial [Fibrobacteria bacterium]|nr:NAD(P)-dependent glycerol-3-phosphate dehydrogenase [Fibrobacteria bacterium]